jgi:hypothetical protein
MKDIILNEDFEKRKNLKMLSRNEERCVKLNRIESTKYDVKARVFDRESNHLESYLMNTCEYLENHDKKLRNSTGHAYSAQDMKRFEKLDKNIYKNQKNGLNLEKLDKKTILALGLRYFSPG